MLLAVPNRNGTGNLLFNTKQNRYNKGCYEGTFIAYQTPLILQRTDTSRERVQSRVLDHMDGPWMGSPE
jgi:hypothetical protein